MPYQPLTEATVVDYVKNLPEVLSSVFLPGDTLRGVDLADGNVNLVYRVSAEQNLGRTVIVKQALPYARVVGESFPMPLERSRIEADLLQIEARYAPEFVPRLYHHDPEMYAIVMEDLNQHIIMRKGLNAQVVYPHFAQHLGVFIARTLFYTSDLYLPHEVKKEMMAKHINPGLCKVTEDLVFTHPFMEHPGNKWNAELQPEVDEIRANNSLRSEIFLLKEAFMTHAQALIHGDLHTGSIMVNERETKVIDPEFAFYGPMGFDIGAVLGNLALAYCAQPGHVEDPEKCAEYRLWLLDTIREVWNVFETEFRRLWNEELNRENWDTDEFREKYIRRLLQDTTGFGGTKMMRRILGLAHVLDLEAIPDPQRRATCESQALDIGQRWVMNRERVRSIEDLIVMIKESKAKYPYGA
ncbi:MAG: S-methyl-5-thioribose kinase [Anaerolineae bacterium]|nr:S-methyl-5-thioribose kinase [Anaerolineae bacterium]